jgi:hypothetical protein
VSRSIYHEGVAQLTGYVGSKCVGFNFTEERGRGKSHRSLLVNPQLVLDIADMIRKVGGDMGDHIGHVVYHLQRPTLAVPCSTCPAHNPDEDFGRKTGTIRAVSGQGPSK